MLVVEPRKASSVHQQSTLKHASDSKKQRRIDCFALVKKLKDILQQGENNDEYFTEPSRRGQAKLKSGTKEATQTITIYDSAEGLVQKRKSMARVFSTDEGKDKEHRS